MVSFGTLNVGIPALPSPEEALAVLRRIINAWELDRFDAALVGSTSVDFATIEWTEDGLLRAAYLIELEKALIGLSPKTRVARWIATEGSDADLDPTRVAVAGDSVGGNMAAALTLLAKQRGDVSFARQALFYPVTDASFDTPSYQHFAEGSFLRRDASARFKGHSPAGTVCYL